MLGGEKTKQNSFQSFGAESNPTLKIATVARLMLPVGLYILELKV